MINSARLRSCLFATLLLAGCSHLLPTTNQTTQSPWNSYEEARIAFDSIQPGATSIEELWGMGFDPLKRPNIRVLNHLDVMRLFVPNDSIHLADLHPDIQTCLLAKTDCQGYMVTLGNTYRERYGNAMLDVLNFRRKTRTSGWQFQGLIVLKKSQVIYKLVSGQPNILEFEDKKNPLGPLQDISVPTDFSLHN
ncbi:MAG: hypothetical protein H6R07_961 [Proteobacteria bacterium]|nr:hypothetical protein [Pseudomonadota bacterium]